MSDALRFTTSVDMALFDRAVLRYIEDLGIALPKVVFTTAGQLNAELLKFTPPKTHAQGRAAVKRDIGRAMWLMDPAKIHNKILAQAVRDEEFDVVKAFMSRIRNQGGTALGSYRLEHFSPQLHQSVRDRRGRVRRSRKVIVLERSDYNRYVREIQGNVGATKFGWAISGRHLGVAIPKWVLGHSENQGDFQQDKSPESPNVVMTNRAPGVDALGAGFIQRMVDRRTKAMTRDVDQVLAGRASRYFD